MQPSWLGAKNQQSGSSTSDNRLPPTQLGFFYSTIKLSAYNLIKLQSPTKFQTWTDQSILLHIFIYSWVNRNHENEKKDDV